MNANCAKYWFLVCRFCAKYWCLLSRFCAKVLVLALPLLCQGTGACFAIFVPKYWCLLCCFCAEVLELCLLSLCQITGAQFVAIDCCCLSKLPVVVFSMYANVPCRCMAYQLTVI